jgi:hypothetical protein
VLFRDATDLTALPYERRFEIASELIQGSDTLVPAPLTQTDSAEVLTRELLDNIQRPRDPGDVPATARRWQRNLAFASLPHLVGESGRRPGGGGGVLRDALTPGGPATDRRGVVPPKRGRDLSVRVAGGNDLACYRGLEFLSESAFSPRLAPRQLQAPQAVRWLGRSALVRLVGPCLLERDDRDWP